MYLIFEIISGGYKFRYSEAENAANSGWLSKNRQRGTRDL